jgi:hypothetical protein
MAMPLMVAPMAMHGLAHPAKELGTACAAAAGNTPMVRQPAGGDCAYEFKDKNYALRAYADLILCSSRHDSNQQQRTRSPTQAAWPPRVQAPGNTRAAAGSLRSLRQVTAVSLHATSSPAAACCSAYPPWPT